MQIHEEFQWLEELKVAFTFSGEDGTIIYMNDAAATVFSNDGGSELVGKNVLDCHPEPARAKLQDLFANPRVNAYTIQKAGKRKLIYQAPVFENGAFKGIVEISLPLPDEIPHFERK